jgi:hypothetical protein
MSSSGFCELLLQGMRETIQRKATERQSEVDARRAAIAAATADNETLRSTVAAQPLSKADVQRMAHERCATRSSVCCGTVAACVPQAWQISCSRPSDCVRGRPVCACVHTQVSTRT